MKRAILITGALVAIGGSAFALTKFVDRAGPNSAGFAPEAGASTDYVVGQRVTARPLGAATPERWVQTYGVMRYRFEDFGDKRQLHVEPLLVHARNEDELLLTTDLVDAAPSPDFSTVMHGGLDLPFENNRPQRGPEFGRTFSTLGEKIDAAAGNPWVDQVVVPTLPTAIDARVGATLELAAYRGLSAMRLRVTHVDDDNILLRIEPTADTRALDMDQQPAELRFVGRMRVNRHDGWLESLTLVRRDVVERDGRTLAIDRITHAQRRADLTRADARGLLDPFRGIGDESGREIELPESDRDSAQPAPAVDDPQLDKARTALSVEFGQLNLHLGLDSEQRVPLFTIALRDITFYDAAGHAIDPPIVFQTMLPAYDTQDFDDGRMYSYLALGDDPSVFDQIDHAEATVTYRPSQSQYLTLPLDGEAHERQHGKAKVAAWPDPQQPDRWWLRLQDSATVHYAASYARALPGATVMADIAPEKPWYGAGAARLLTQVDNAQADVRYLRVDSQQSPLDYPLERTDFAEPRTYRVTFERRESP
ncbi:hypothetical protein S4A8_05183 [Salinisphaera sp. S4-8]|uniref:hypothetical protein n=1 Tax=Salinisphaera sp. S4-8 TaxID=633357 RepID=UPI00333E79B0